jgi:Flp pilus assembly pilin Flp
LAALFAAALSGPTAVEAGTIVGLVDGNSLVMIDAASRKVTGKVHIKGAFDRIVGIDVRPASTART